MDELRRRRWPSTCRIRRLALPRLAALALVLLLGVAGRGAFSEGFLPVKETNTMTDTGEVTRVDAKYLRGVQVLQSPDVPELVLRVQHDDGDAHYIISRAGLARLAEALTINARRLAQ
jgi:hypothetical protein